MITEPCTATPGDLSWSVAAGAESPGPTVHRTTSLLDPYNSTLARAIPVTANALNRAVVVIDAGFNAHFALDIRWYFEKWSIPAEFVVLDVGGACTTTQCALTLAVRLGELRVDRHRAPLVAIGGRSVLEVVDVVATIFDRGAPNVVVPTTLLAQVLASVTSVPSRAPTEVLVDTAFLATLPRRHVADGLAEVLTAATLGDAQLFELLETNGPALFDRQRPGAAGEELVSRAIGMFLAEQEPNSRNTLAPAIAKLVADVTAAEVLAACAAAAAPFCNPL